MNSAHSASVNQLVSCVCSWLQHMTGLRILLYVVMVTRGELMKPISCYACYRFCSLYQVIFLSPTVLECYTTTVFVKIILFFKFDPEDGGSLGLRNLDINSQDSRLSKPKDQNINFYTSFKSGSLQKNHRLKIKNTIFISVCQIIQL